MRWLRWIGLWTGLGVVASAQLYLAHQRPLGTPYTWRQALETGLPGWWVWAVLTPIVVWLARRFRVDRETFGRHFFIHLGASLDLALLQLLAAVGVQDVLHAVHHEPFGFAQGLVEEFTASYHWNVLLYWAILAIAHALAYYRALEGGRGMPRPAERVLVADGGRSVFVRTADVDWIEASRNYVRLHTGERSYLARTTLVALAQRLDPERFRRANRSALVNLDRVREVQPWFHGDAIVILESGARVTLSRRYRAHLLGTAAATAP